MEQLRRNFRASPPLGEVFANLYADGGIGRLYRSRAMANACAGRLGTPRVAVIRVRAKARAHG